MRLIDADELIEHAWRDKLDSRELIVEMIDNAPIVKEIPTNIPLDVFEKLVSQKPKTGHWIEHPEIKTSAPEYLVFYECSECGDEQCFCKLDIHKKRFCSNCGCRMFEPQESEE